VQKHNEDGEMMRRRLLVGILPLVGVLTIGAPMLGHNWADAAATPQLPVSNSFAASFAAGFGQPATPPPGANRPNCKPSAQHPNPVVLVHGTAENMNDNWRGASPLLANNGYCVFAFNYGGATPNSPIQGTGEIKAGAGQLATFVNQVLASTGASKVDIVGHSQGGMMPRAYIKYFGGAGKVGKLVGITPSNNGTTLDGLTQLGQQLGLLQQANFLLNLTAPALAEQEVGSAFLTALNAGGETVPGVSYTVIATNGDEVVTPFTNAFLPAAPNVRNITVQNQCAKDMTDHLEAPYDPITLTDMLNALDPAHPRQVPCVAVRPIVGP
jgi:triacylglycerol esterase/lipase EstA (alpha/beta hydrolase family)